MSNWNITLNTPQDVAYQGQYDNRSGDYYLQSSSFYKDGTPHNAHITVSLQVKNLNDSITHFHISLEFSSGGGGSQNMPIYFNYNGTNLRMTPNTTGKTPEVIDRFYTIYNDIKPELKQMAKEFFDKYAEPANPVNVV